MLISKKKEAVKIVNGVNLIPNEGICYTYSSLGGRLKNNLLPTKVELPYWY